MFSALRFLVAGVIVALCGGFLLTGVLTTQQEDEVLPATVTESAGPEATPSPTEPSGPVVRTDILPGVGLTVEEVQPGVYRVVHDGVRDLAYHPGLSDLGGRTPDIIAGDDGGIWVLHGDAYYRLGVEHAESEYDVPNRHLPVTVVLLTDFEVAPDGTVWAAVETMAAPANAPDAELHIWSFDGERDDLHVPTALRDGPVEVTPDGTVWAVWLDDPLEDRDPVFGYRGADGWTKVGDGWPGGSLHVSDAGEVWAAGGEGWFHTPPHRFVDGAWHRIDDYPAAAWAADVGPDGTVWAVGHGGWGIGFEGAARFDAAGRMTSEPPEWLPTDYGGWMLVEDEWVFVPGPDYEAALEEAEEADQATTFRASFPAIPWGEPHVAPDGSLWVPARLGVWWDNAGQPICDHGIDGLARHDGAMWSRHLEGHCIEDMDIAADGSVWLLASESGARFPLVRLYVITPDALTASE